MKKKKVKVKNSSPKVHRSISRCTKFGSAITLLWPIRAKRLASTFQIRKKAKRLIGNNQLLLGDETTRSQPGFASGQLSLLDCKMDTEFLQLALLSRSMIFRKNRFVSTRISHNLHRFFFSTDKENCLLENPRPMRFYPTNSIDLHSLDSRCFFEPATVWSSNNSSWYSIDRSRSFRRLISSTINFRKKLYLNYRNFPDKFMLL